MKKIVLLSLGWLCVGLAFVGILVPGIPTTIFLIIALWAFTQSSKKFQTWLLNHKKFGPILKNWQSHKVVPQRAKILMAILQITAVILVHYVFNNLIITISLAVILIFVALYVFSLPNKTPLEKN